MSTNLPTERPEEPRSDLPVAAGAPHVPPAGYSPPPALDDEPGLNPRQLLDSILRHKWLLAALTILGAIGGFVVSRFQSLTYEAQATIWVELAGQQRGPIQTGQLLENTNWLDLLRSFTVLDSVVKEQRLFLTIMDGKDAPLFRAFELQAQFRPGAYELRVDETGRRFELAVKGGEVVQRGAPGDSVGAGLGIIWLPPAQELRPGRVVGFSVRPPRQAALDVNSRLAAQLPQRDGNFIRLKLQGPDGPSTAATLNSVAEQFVHVAAELKRAKLTELSRILAEQLQSAAIELRRAEVALETFRVSTITEPTDESPPVAAGLAQTQAPALQSYFVMRTDRDQLRRDREAIQEVLARSDTVSAVELEAISNVRSATALMGALADLTNKQATLRALRTRYTDTNPQVQRLADEITTLQRQSIPAMLQALVGEIRIRETQLDQRLAMTSRDLREIPTRSIEEARLRREMSIADALYTTLQSRYSEARLAEASSIPDVRILDPASVPDRPIMNVGPMFLIGGTAIGFGLAVGIALLLGRFDRRLRYPDQVTRELGLAILGAVPRVEANGNGIRGQGAAQVVEALRTVRLNLVHAYGSAGPLVTTVTSPGSGDGKSFMASNLALAFADAGHRTLLVDGDIRRGTLHRALGAQRKPGLLDYLGGQATREDVIQKTRVEAVDFIGCGTRKMGGPELLASAAMSQLIIALRSQYNVIIIDSAPLGAGVDPLVLGSITGSLLLVLRTGVTDKELTNAKLGDLDRLPIRVLGAILNDVKPTGAYRYYGYLPGYGSDDEESESETRRLGAGAS
jgi:tyrosine-protein kinase Etk/Wzc